MISKDEMEKFKRILKEFSSKTILLYGDVMLDEFLFGEVNRLSPEAPVQILDVKSTTYAPGGAANTACNIKAMGGNVILCGVVGDDDNATKLRSLLKSRGIDPSSLVVDPSRPTITKTRAMAAKQHLLRIDREVKEDVNSGIVMKVVEFTLGRIKDVDAVVISEYDKGFVTGDLIKSIIEIAKANGKPVIVDPKYTNVKNYRDVDVVKPNAKEAMLASDIKITDNASAIAAANAIKRITGCKSVVITRGGDGIIAVDGSGSNIHYASIAPQEGFIDVTGAGDTTTAALALAYASGASLFDAARISNIAGGQKVKKLGTATVSRDEIIEALLYHQ